ncbi:MAG: sulfite exporter TauE/SafE family protein [Pseudomonadota bacterium]
MTVEFLLPLLGGAIAGGFVNGLAGFGTSLFALGWWLQILPPKQAVVLVLILSVFSGLQGAWVVRNSIEPRRLAIFVVPALVGIPVGLHVLQWIDVDLLKLLVAAFLLTYAVFFIARRNLPAFTAETPIVDGGIGFVGGILGATAGLSGALPTMWLAMRDWQRQKVRAVLQPYNIVVLGISAVLLVIDGVLDRQTLIAFVVAFPATMLAAQAGLWVFGRLSDAQFRWLLVSLMLMSGLGLLFRTIF